MLFFRKVTNSVRHLLFCHHFTRATTSHFMIPMQLKSFSQQQANQRSGTVDLYMANLSAVPLPFTTNLLPSFSPSGIWWLHSPPSGYIGFLQCHLCSSLRVLRINGCFPALPHTLSPRPTWRLTAMEPSRCLLRNDIAMIDVNIQNYLLSHFWDSTNKSSASLPVCQCKIR